MIKHVEELRVESQLHVLRHGEPLRCVKVAPEEVRTAESIAGQIPKLAVFCRVAPIARACRWINRGDERIRIEPLDRSRLSYTADVAVATVWVNTRNETGELRPTALHDAISVCRVWRAENRKRYSAVKEKTSRNPPFETVSRQWLQV